VKPLLIGCLALWLVSGDSWAQRPGRRPIIAQGELAAGDPAPDFALLALDGKTQVKLSALRGKPVVLIFGSCTCPPFVASIQATSRLHETYKDRVHFLLVYIREAHPTDGWAVPGNQFEVASPKTTEERLAIARDFAKRLNVSMPIVADATDDQVDATYAAWPNRMYILDAKGKIADAGRAGPDGTAKSAQRAPAILDSLLTSAP
jgi:cytochrome oxidase Cu insertion factor (SCO1/SenC/PrrC family)